MTVALTIDAVRSDLLAEQEALDVVVSGLTAEQWSTPTPSPGWTVADQIGHLTYFDNTAALAITDPQAFAADIARLMSALGTSSDPTLAESREQTRGELLHSWRTNRRSLADAARTLDDTSRVAWYGPSMGAKSFLTARLMEVWAHGQDVVDAVGARRESTDRLRHIAQLGYITRGWSYANRRLEMPDVAVRVQLDAPSGAVWRFGPDDAPQSVVGDAAEFCLVVTQRRHVSETALLVGGDAAMDWMLKAQVFAGGATTRPASNLGIVGD